MLDSTRVLPVWHLVVRPNRFPLALDQTRSEDGMLEAWISSR